MAKLILTTVGFQKCNFDDGACDFCRVWDAVIWYMPSGEDGRDGDYYCSHCAIEAYRSATGEDVEAD